MFCITLDEFEGAPDLLLFFIKRDELDIHTIPLSKITGDFIAWIRAMQALILEVAAEFSRAGAIVRVVTFLAVPEPCRDRKIVVLARDGHSDFWIFRRDHSD